MSRSPYLQSTTIRQRIGTIKKVLERLKRVYEREVRGLNHQIADLQARCPHYDVKAMPRKDLYRCKICGFESVQPIKADPERAKQVQEKQSRVRVF